MDSFNPRITMAKLTDKKIHSYFSRIGKKGGKGCSPSKLAHLRALAESRRKKVSELPVT